MAGAEEALALAIALLPPQVTIERPVCSSPAHAPDLIARMTGTGRPRLVLLGHVDTVIRHAGHRPLTRDEGRLIGTGTVDMKGGVVLALGVLRALAERPELYAEASLLLVVDEEWRTADFGHAPAFAGFDACLCFEAGQRTADGQEAVVVRRKAAGTLKVTAEGRSAHSGSAPDKGRNALLALAAAAQAVAAHHDPAGPERLSAVPTIVRSGEAFNVVPADGELFCDLRADRSEAFGAVVEAVPEAVGGAVLESRMMRCWPGMDTRLATRAALAGSAEHLGRPVVGARRGGASDASHMARIVPLTIDGLGPLGGGAHTPVEYVRAESLRERAEVALALTTAVLADPVTG